MHNYLQVHLHIAEVGICGTGLSEHKGILKASIGALYVTQHIYLENIPCFISCTVSFSQVRPCMPQQYVEQLYKCKPVQVELYQNCFFDEKSNVNWCISQVEPLFKMWKESDLATTKSRVAAIVKVWAKKREL